MAKFLLEDAEVIEKRHGQKQLKDVYVNMPAAMIINQPQLIKMLINLGNYLFSVQASKKYILCRTQ